jgi:mono/diheme cytochrome c family protein
MSEHLRAMRLLPVLGTAAMIAVGGLIGGGPPPVAARVPGQSAQVVQGEQVYARACQSCHGANLEGTVGPPLDAARLTAYGTAARLYQYVRGTMPMDAPGSLSEQEYYDVIAYLLQRNGLLPPETTLDASTAADIALRP